MMRLRPSLPFLLILIAFACSASAQIAVGRPAPAPVPAGITGTDGGVLVKDSAGNPAVRYSVAHPVALAVEHGYLTISRERVTFAASNGRGFDHARSDLTLAREWTNMFGASQLMAEFKFNDGTVWHFTNESSQIRGGGLFSPRVTNYMALVNAANNPEGALAPLEAVADARNNRLSAAQRGSEPDKEAMMDPAMALYLASAQASDDGVIGLWSGSSNNMNWQSAIVKNPNRDHDGYDYIGVLVEPWPLYFKKGEAHLYLKKTSTPGAYEGIEKWRNNLGSAWAPARVTLRDINNFAQSNQINFATPLGTDWNLARKSTAGVTVASLNGPQTSTLKVIAQPGGIQVYVDDKFKGSTSEKEGVLVVENLQPGSSKVRLSQKGFVDFTQNVTLTAGETAKLETNLAAEGPKPLGEPEIEEALKNGVPKTRIMGLIREYGVDFVLTNESEQSLRTVGADSDLLLAIAKSKK
jgi:hypothetical protein